jgi:uncharacterized ferredoxin-like protein
MSGTIGYDELRAATVHQVAQLMAAAAITAPKSGGQLFLAGKPNFMETVIAEDPGTRRDLAAWMRARGKERRERIWFRDADAAEAVDAILFIGLLPGWYPPNYDCGACGYATCAEFLHHTKPCAASPPNSNSPARSATCATSTPASPSAQPPNRRHPLDRLPVPDPRRGRRKLGLIQADHAVALSLSMTHKAVGFDRPMPEVDFDDLDLPPTGTQPVGVLGAARQGGARNRQAPRQPIRPTQL